MTTAEVRKWWIEDHILNLSKLCCECIRSLLGTTQCWRCRELFQLRKDLEESQKDSKNA